MRSKTEDEKMFLRGLLLISLGILPVLMNREPKKDWLVAYVYNAITNFILDKWVTNKLITYPTRMLPKIFKIHVLFDFVLYPTATVIYNQMTSRDKKLAIVYKVFLFSVPLTAFEYWAERNTGLIKWNKGWKWYHTLLGVSLKSLTTRGVVGLFRMSRNGVFKSSKRHFSFPWSSRR